MTLPAKSFAQALARSRFIGGLAGHNARKRRRKIKPPKIPYPHALEQAYVASLVAFVKQLRGAADRLLVSQLPTLWAEANPKRDSVRADDWVADVDRIMRTMRISFDLSKRGAEERVAQAGFDVSNYNKVQFRKAVNVALGVDVIGAEPKLGTLMAAWTHENVSLIRSIPDKLLADLEPLVMREFRSGDRWEDLADAIGKQFDVSENRARLIGRDQTSKLNGQLTEERQTNLGIEEYIWSNSQDERVRGNPDGVYPDASPSHWEMEGMICRWDDPSVYREPDSGPDDWQPRSNIDGPEEHPGEPIICRCVALPNLDPLLEQLPGGADLVEQNATPDAGAEE